MVIDLSGDGRSAINNSALFATAAGQTVTLANVCGAGVAFEPRHGDVFCFLVAPGLEGPAANAPPANPVQPPAVYRQEIEQWTAHGNDAALQARVPLRKARTLLLGERGTAKSSFINTVLSGMLGQSEWCFFLQRVLIFFSLQGVVDAVVEPIGQHVTRTVMAYQVRRVNGLPCPVDIADMWGWRQNYILDVRAVVRGKVDWTNGTSWEAADLEALENNGVVPTLDDEVHTVFMTLAYGDRHHADTRAHMRDTITYLRDRSIPVVVLLTKCDEADSLRQSDLSDFLRRHGAAAREARVGAGVGSGADVCVSSCDTVLPGGRELGRRDKPHVEHLLARVCGRAETLLSFCGASESGCCATQRERRRQQRTRGCCTRCRCSTTTTCGRSGSSTGTRSRRRRWWRRRRVHLPTTLPQVPEDSVVTVVTNIAGPTPFFVRAVEW